MNPFRTLCFFALRAAILLPVPLFAATPQELHRSAPPQASTIEWKASSAEHAYGLPDTKPGKKGTLSLDANGLTFTSKTSNTTIERGLLTAVSAGNDRVELWGTTGRIMRMVMPNGSGLAAAAVMHHRVDMLTVEFRDTHGGMHSAVFYLPAKEADQALQYFSKDSFAVPTPVTAACTGAPVEPRSVLVEMPTWDKAEVPAAYRALVYEHVIDRLKTAKNLGHVYRAGEITQGTPCPQYTIKIAVQAYKKGNQVVRAATGPIGMFTSATQLQFTVTYTDASGTLNKTEDLKAAVRTESESTGVADAVAKKLTKQYVKLLATVSQQAASPAGTSSPSTPAAQAFAAN